MLKGLATSQLVVILLGPPGVGKGSQALLLAKHLGLPHISTGDLFRENIRQGTPLGVDAKKYMDQGLLVPDILVVDMLMDRIHKEDCQKGYLLDGFPRTENQAELLEKALGEECHLKVFEFAARDEVVISRISGRLVCKKCSRPYHKISCPAKIDNTCDDCSSELYQRTDDAEAVVLDRLRVYHKQTAPLLEFYKKRKTLVTINCERPLEAITKELLESL